jgi:hypothetical protein
MDVQDDHEEPPTPEEEVTVHPRDIWYIKRKSNGQIEGEITFNETAGLEIKPSQLNAPSLPQDDQRSDFWARSVTPRQISIQAQVRKGDDQPLSDFEIQYEVKGVQTGFHLITSLEFGTAIFAKQEGLLIFCKWIDIYYNCGGPKAKYCELTYFIEVRGDELIPNWKLFQLGRTDIETCGLQYLDCFRHHYRESAQKIYRISQVSIPTIENAQGHVNRIILLDRIQL